MRISIETLERIGFNVDIDRGIISITPDNSSTEILEQVHRLLEMTDIRKNSLFYNAAFSGVMEAVSDAQIFEAIKEASGD